MIRKIPLTVLLDPDTIQELESNAKRQDKPLSALIRETIKRGLKRDNEQFQLQEPLKKVIELEFSKNLKNMRVIGNTDIKLHKSRLGEYFFWCSCDLSKLYPFDENFIRTNLKDTFARINIYADMAERYSNRFRNAKSFREKMQHAMQLKDAQAVQDETIGLQFGVDTSIVITCPKCGRGYRFEVRLESLFEIPNIDAIEAYKEFGFDKSDSKMNEILEREALSWKLSGRSELLKWIDCLQSEPIQIENFLNDIIQVTKRYENVQGELFVALLKSFKDGATQSLTECLAENERTLRQVLESIGSACKEVIEY